VKAVKFLKSGIHGARLVCAARAMLMKADIMLLDEPTNHLDVTNVKWLQVRPTRLFLGNRRFWEVDAALKPGCSCRSLHLAEHLLRSEGTQLHDCLCLEQTLPTAALAPLQDYLTSLTDVTSMVVSHDSGFLDAVCTDIVHYEKDKKLKHYKVRRALFRALHLPFCS
jgi:hypothetical protein